MVAARRADALFGAVRTALPAGGLLGAETWERRHRAILVLLAVHAAVIAAVVSLKGFGVVHAIAEGSVVAIATLVAARAPIPRRLRSVAASFGLLSASAILVHLSGGYIEMHFHFFVMIIVISLYQDWWPFLLAVGYVVLHHGVIGVIDPRSVYNHPAAIAEPWLWAGIHGTFILGASVAAIAAWRLNEDLARRQLATERRARAAAEAGVRARENFLSIATHELRTPVTSIKGYAQLALRAADSDPLRVRQLLQTLDGQTDRLSRLITQLLDVSRIEAGRLRLEPERTDLGLLVLTLVETAKAHATPHEWEIDVPTAVFATIDPGRIEQVVSNLLENAVRYSPDGGAISVRLRREDGRVRLDVVDTGIGIPAADVGHIFERFYQAHSDRNYGGMGLGLYISREIVERHGGMISVVSPSGGGAHFTVVLPVQAAEPAVVPAPPARESKRPQEPAPRPRHPSGPATIWVVEDDHDIREVVSTFLTDAGYDVAAFASGRAALARFIVERPALILLDKLMPEMSGSEVARALRELPPPHPLLTGMCAARDAQDWAASIGAAGVIAKPFDLGDIRATIERHLGAPRPGSS